MSIQPSITQQLQAARQCVQRGDLASARDSLQATLLQAPQQVEALAMLGQVLHAQREHGAALVKFDRAIALAPTLATLRANRSAVRLALGDIAGAIEDGESASRMQEDGFGAWLNLGLAREQLGEYAAASQAFERALALRPDDLATLKALSRCLYQRGDAHRRSRVLLQQVLERDPDDSRARLLLANSLVDDAEVSEALLQFHELLRRHPRFHQAHSNYLIALQYHAASTPQELLEAHREWGRLHATPSSAADPIATAAGHASPRGTAAGLRIGWISPRFSDGPLASFVLPAMEALRTRAGAQVFYCNGPASGSVAARFRACASQWIEVATLDDAALVHRIASDGLDLLVDLAGHAPGNRLRALSRHPAPLQVSWGDYFCTTGVPGIDVFFSDGDLSPPGSERFFSERLVRLATGRFCFRPALVAPDPGERTGDELVFACFNRVSKLGDAVLSTWASILDALPLSRLELRAGSFDDADAREFFLQRARRAGLDPSRITLHGFASHAAVMQAYRNVDIALDPFPFSGCATSADALWMGVPVVTLAGETLASRQTHALLARVGVTDLSAHTAQDYVHTAVTLAQDTARRATLRRELRQRLSERLDPDRFAQEFLQQATACITLQQAARRA